MHGMHARLPRNFVLEERLQRYADAIELEPARWAGLWATACWPLADDRACESSASTSLSPTGARSEFREVRLDLGCGKGAFVVEAARREPDVLFLAMDAEPLCIAYAAQHITEAGLRNAVAVPGKGSVVPGAFGRGELSCIHLNFPTPYPRKKDAHKRLVLLDRLIEYRHVLAPQGTVRLRTDSQPLRDFALTQFDMAGYDIVWSSDNERAELPNEPASEYEERLVAQGATVFGVWARPSDREPSLEQTASLSLMDYLPDDLFGGGYVPHGMSGAVTNLRNRRQHAASLLKNG